jgi:hypothetical protein
LHPTQRYRLPDSIVQSTLCSVLLKSFDDVRESVEKIKKGWLGYRVGGIESWKSRHLPPHVVDIMKTHSSSTSTAIIAKKK